MTHWTQVLSNVSLVEFVLLAALTALQWARHRIRGAGWVALSFAILGGLSLTVKLDPTLVTNQNMAKVLVALLLVMPYCLFRFAASFRPPSRTVHALALAVTVGIIAFTFALSYLPARGAAPPPYFLAYRVAFAVAFGFLFTYVVVSLFSAGKGEPLIASFRMRLLAVAVAGLEVQVVVAALGLRGPAVELATRALTVAMGILFLVALVLPSFVRVVLSRKEDVAFRQAIGQLVSAGDSRDVAEHLLPHVCALVGASEAALLSADGTVVARYPVWLDGEGIAAWDAAGNANGAEEDERRRRVTVRTDSGATHSLAVKISPYMPYFGIEELHKLDELASMVGLAIERCEMAEQMAFQASHDGLTGLANRSLFVDRLQESLRHVGRRRAALAVMFIDLDRFKLVNDRADHSAGDLILNEMANRLNAMTRRGGRRGSLRWRRVRRLRRGGPRSGRPGHGRTHPARPRRAGQDRRRPPGRDREHRHRGHPGCDGRTGHAAPRRRQRHVRRQASGARSGRAPPHQRARRRQPQVGPQPHPRLTAQRKLSSRR